MRSLAGIVTIVSFLIAAGSAAAQTVLPLRQGSFVLEGTPCQGAANAAIRTWDGKGFGGAHESQCTTLARPSVNGSTYRVTTTCHAQGDGSPAKPATDTVYITLRNDHAFSLKSGRTRLDYRWCGAL